MRFLSLIAGATVLLSGCAGFTTLPSAEHAAKLSDRKLCMRGRSNLCGGIYGCPIDKYAVEEIKNRGLVPENEWPLIYERKIKIGMSECGMNVSVGGHPRINESVGRWGRHKQYVYERIGMYIYVENGFVTSWQD